MIKIKSYSKRFKEHVVLSDININIAEGENVVLIGASGSGKTTLVRSINGMVVPDTGEVLVDNEKINFEDRKALRNNRKHIGMIYQGFNLVERTTALHNVLTGALGRLDTGMNLFKSSLGFFKENEKQKAHEMLSFVRIDDRHDKRVDKLSGGEKQRVAIARALMQEPRVLLADEPIANLDPEASRKIIKLLLKVNREKKVTVVTVLHDVEMAKKYFDRVIAIRKNSVFFDGKPADLHDSDIEAIYDVEKENRIEH
jgi:phosphonate transport system ATP-binding protein